MTKAEEIIDISFMIELEQEILLSHPHPGDIIIQVDHTGVKQLYMYK